jgi:hypothetical protein
MSAGSDASNLGYGNIKPFSNINGEYVNITSSNNPAFFGSNQIPGLPGIAGAKNNVDAAKGYIPGFFGGAKVLKKKIKNISRKYKKMPRKSKTSKSIRNRIKHYMSKLNRKTKSKHSRKHKQYKHKTTKHRKIQKGGYSQYQNNLPLTPSYSLGGHLGPNNSALANPPPINVYKGSGQCVDNYNHYTNKGFPSPGH